MNDAALQKLKDETRNAVEQGKQVRQALRKLTVQALQRSRLEAESTRVTVQAILQGIMQGLARTGSATRQNLSEAMAGMDEALAIAAEASGLALEEAAGRARDFAQQDVRKGYEELRLLEQMFLETAGRVAQQSRDEAGAILREMLSHANTSGTAAGAAVADALRTLEQKLGRELREVAGAGSTAALQAGASLAGLMGETLSRLASVLDKQADKLHSNKLDGKK